MQTWDSMATSGSWTSSKFILGATSILASAGGDPLFGIKRRSIGDQLVVKETSIVRDAGEISMGFVCFCAWQLAGFPFIPLFFANSRAVWSSSCPAYKTLACKYCGTSQS